MMRHGTGLAALAAFAGLSLGLAPQVRAQSRQLMVMENDDNGVQSTVQYSLPDFHALFTPDYTRDDLALFKKRLRLDGLQQELVAALIDAYLDDFNGLRETHMPDVGDGGGGLFIGGGGDMAFQLDPLNEEAGDEKRLRDVIDEVTDGAGGSGSPAGIEIMITAGGPPGGGGAGDGDGDEGGVSAGVQIALPEGVELTEEQQKQLADMAEKMAERIKERVEAEEAAGGGAAMPFVDIEDRMQKMDEMLAGADALLLEKAALKKKLESTVRGMLLPEQQLLWPRFEWALTRKNTLPSGRLDGERTDLYRLLEQLDVDPEGDERLGEEVETYEQSLHAALVARNAYLAESRKDLDEALASGKHDKAVSIADKAARLREAVRDTNTKYVEELAALMNEVEAYEFKQRFLERSYPSVYRTTRTEKAFDGVLELEDLAEDVRETVETLQELYLVELEATNERLREAIDRWEPGQPGRMFKQMGEMAGGGAVMFGMDDEDSPVAEAHDKRRKLGERYLKRLRSLLSEAQRDQITWLKPASTRPVRIERVIGNPPGRQDN